MTVEEIKQSTTMKDVLSRYNVEVKKGMCCCPIHKEKHPSMQVFKDGYKCHACQRHGDIFKFVMEMENCDFKTAFISLGGTYDKDLNKQHKKLIQKKFERQKIERQEQNTFEDKFHKMLCDSISKCRKVIQEEEPFSDRWCICVNALDWLLYILDEKYILEGGVNKADVIRMCGRIKRV